jgi:ABC-type transport system involved in multi-copper enzyme maturation permease subunit
MAITVVAVVVRALVGHAVDHDLQSMMRIALQPTTILLPVLGILLVTSEWSQRTGQITFTLTPRRSRILVAKLLASALLAVGALVLCLGVAASATALAGAGLRDTWSYDPTLLGQAAIYLVSSMVAGVALGAVMLAPAPAIVVNFALPTAWVALSSLSVFAGVAPWLDPGLDGMAERLLSSTQWAHAGTALAFWVALPLLSGAYRITRREISA